VSAGAPAGTVVVTWVGFDFADPECGGAFAARGLATRFAPRERDRTPAEMAALVGDAVAVIADADPYDRAVLEGAPDLRVIARVGVGLDGIDLEAASALGVAVTITPGLNTETVADHALALMLAATRRVVEHDAGVRRGQWRRVGPMAPWDLHGRTVGVVGYGSIGRAVARRLAGFEVRILVCDPEREQADGLELTSVEDLLARSDLISLHCPLTPATRGLIGARALGLMRPGAILVNTSRGGLVDEEALLGALSSGRLRAAGLDVFAAEPPPSPRLRALPNVVLSPHIGGVSVDSNANMTRQAVRSALAVLRGEAPEGLVNPDALLAAPREGR
jgi:phosphoglycerate dehydrogenase-like enzyme